MRPFQQFRYWLRRAPVGECTAAALASLIAVALLGWLLVPADEDAADTSTSLLAGGDAGEVAPDGATAADGTGATSEAEADGGESGDAAPTPAATPTQGAGSSSGPSPAGPSAQAGEGRRCPGGNAPGVTDKQVKVAVTLAQLVGAAGNQIFNLPTPQEQQAKYQAVLKAVNAEGGIACRAVVAQYFTVNTADQSDMHAKCLQVRDSGAFAVLDDGGEALAPDCFGVYRIPYLGNNLLFEETAAKYYPYLMSVWSLYDQQYRNMVFGLKERGFFDPAGGFKKLGFIYFNCQPGVIQKITGWLGQVGVSGDQLVAYNAGCPSPPLARPSDLQQAILRFRSEGVTHVTVANFLGSLGQFTSIAQQQGFKPKYGVADDGYVAISYGAGRPDPANFDGAVAITSARSGEERSPGATPTAGTARCDDIMRKAGLESTYQDGIASNGGFVCDLVWMLKAALDRAPAISREAIAPSLQGAGTLDFSFPLGPTDFAATKGVAGGNSWRTLQFHGNCSCWKVADANFRPSFR